MQLVLRASNLLSQTVNKSTVLSLSVDISHNWLLQRTHTDTDHQQHGESGNTLAAEKSVGAAASINIENIKVKTVHKRNIKRICLHFFRFLHWKLSLLILPIDIT